jgi:hypothetical protein
MDPIQKAIDDYIVMQQKAQAWDALYDLMARTPANTPLPSARGVQAKMDSILGNLLTPTGGNSAGKSDA